MGTKTCKVNIKALKTLPQIECKLNVLKNGEVIAYKKRKNIEADLDYLILTNDRYKMLKIYGENNCFWGMKDGFPDKFRTTSELTTCNNMFDRCMQVKEIDLSHFNTSNVTDFSMMFFRCESLEKLDVSYLDTSKATDISGMFSACDSLKELDVSTLKTSKVTNMAGLFGLEKAEHIIGLDKLDTSKVTNMNAMFRDCMSVKALDLSSWDVSNVTTMNNMFGTCVSLETLDISGWDTSKVENFSSFFQYCGENLREIKGVFDLKSAKNIQSMFCSHSRKDAHPNLKKVKFKNVPKHFSAGYIGLRNDQIEIVS